MSAQHKHLCLAGVCLAGVCLAVDYQSLKYEQLGLHTWVHLLTSMWSNICYHICEMNLKSLLFLCDAHSFGIALSVCSAWRASRGKNLCGFHKHPVYYNLLKATKKKNLLKMTLSSSNSACKMLHGCVSGLEKMNRAEWINFSNELCSILYTSASSNS